MPIFFQKYLTKLNIFNRFLWFEPLVMRFLILLFILCMSFVGLAQQTPQFGLYMMNRYLYNPAFTGYEDYWDIKTGYRQQWTGFNTNMSSFYATANMAFDKTDRTSSGKTPFMSKTIRRTFTPTRIRKKTYRANFHQGLGLQAMTDNFGPLSSISLGASYGYHLSLGGEEKLAVGATVGVYQRSLSIGGFLVKDEEDPYMTQSKLNGIQPLVNVGILYYNRKFHIGLSANQIVMDNYSLTRTNIAENDTVRILWLGQTNPNLFFQFGREIKVGRYWTFSPSILAKYMKNAVFGVEGNFKVNFDDLVWMGASYRHKEAIGVMFGVNLNQSLNMTYLYENHSLGLARTSLGSHEIMIAIKMKNKVYSTNPRW